jgi:hypothetical protein
MVKGIRSIWMILKDSISSISKGSSTNNNRSIINKQSTIKSNSRRHNNHNKKPRTTMNPNLVNSIFAHSKSRTNLKTQNNNNRTTISIVGFIAVTRSSRSQISRILFSRRMRIINLVLILIRRSKRKIIISFWICLSRIEEVRRSSSRCKISI